MRAERNGSALILCMQHTFAPRFSFALLLAFLFAVSVAAQTKEVDVAAQAEQLARDGNTVQAESLVTAFLAQHPHSVPVNVVAGELQAYRRDWPQAMLFFEKALHENPASEPAQRGERDAATALALHQRATQEPEAALATLQRAHNVLPKDTGVLVNVALQAQAMHRLKTAQEAVDAALVLAPTDSRALYASGNIHFDRNEFAKAAEQYRVFLQQHPEDATAHYALGRALRMWQRVDEASEELKRSIALQPVQTEAYYQLGEIALEAGREDEARVNYQKTLERMPTHGGALTGMGMLLYRAHDYAAAKPYLDKAVAAAPDYQPAHYYLGLTLRRTGDAAGAERELGLATELAAKQQGKGAPVGPQ